MISKNLLQFLSMASALEMMGGSSRGVEVKGTHSKKSIPKSERNVRKKKSKQQKASRKNNR